MPRFAQPLAGCFWVVLSGLIAWLFHVKAPNPYMVRILNLLTSFCSNICHYDMPIPQAVRMLWRQGQL